MATIRGPWTRTASQPMAAGKRDDTGLSCLSGDRGRRLSMLFKAVQKEGPEFNIFGEEALFSLSVQPRHFDLVSKPPEDVQLLGNVHA